MKPGIPKGTRDFNPSEVVRRKYIFNTIRNVFEQYGYREIETPVLENLSTLTGKYGLEGDQLLFKVLNNGDFLAKADSEALEKKDSRAILQSISKRGMRYDLTVPFARYVAMHLNEITFPFKRYQIQPVWRADRPQKGRYQEFYQCDADVVGSDSLIYEAEFVKIYDDVFSRLGIPVIIKLNNRKILLGIAEKLGESKRFDDMATAIDKMDKIGWKGVAKELTSAGFEEEKVHLLKDLLDIKELPLLESQFADGSVGHKGLDEVSAVFKYLQEVDLHCQVIFDPTLARGLTYYTGCILEVISDTSDFGSLGGGGRYADLAGMFGLSGIEGTGISFGAERIFDLMMRDDLFPQTVDQALKVIVLSLDESCLEHSFHVTHELRKANIPSDLFPEYTRLKKQLKYADSLQIPYVIIIGPEELNAGLYTLRSMQSGEQTSLTLEGIISHLKQD
jgi:histidyl-tRNA synthetase